MSKIHNFPGTYLQVPEDTQLGPQRGPYHVKLIPKGDEELLSRALNLLNTIVSVDELHIKQTPHQPAWIADLLTQPNGEQNARLELQLELSRAHEAVRKAILVLRCMESVAYMAEGPVASCHLPPDWIDGNAITGNLDPDSYHSLKDV